MASSWPVVLGLDTWIDAVELRVVNAPVDGVVDPIGPVIFVDPKVVNEPVDGVVDPIGSGIAQVLPSRVVALSPPPPLIVPVAVMFPLTKRFLGTVVVPTCVVPYRFDSSRTSRESKDPTVDPSPLLDIFESLGSIHYFY